MDEISQIDAQGKILYINKEDLMFSNIKTGQDLSDFVLQEKSNSAKTYLFIDEIQDIIDFEYGLRSLALDKNIDIYCTGSNAKLLSGELASYLSGRYIEISVFSLSYLEFIAIHGLPENNETIEQFLKYGGLPYLIHLPMEDLVVFEYIKNIYQTILYRDIIQRHSLRNSKFLEQLVQFLANNIEVYFQLKE
jgi:predicted AAA+ superfamily ATPase